MNLSTTEVTPNPSPSPIIDDGIPPSSIVLFPTIPPNESSGSGPNELINNLYGPEGFTSTDWILASIILLILIGIVIFCYCCIKRKVNEKKPISEMSTKTGINQSEMVGVSSSPHNNNNGHNRTGSNQVRPKVAQSFGSAHELPKMDTAAFEAAVAGVALTKQDTNVDIVAAVIPVQQAVIAEEEDFNDDELIALNASLKEQPNVMEQVFSASTQPPEYANANNNNSQQIDDGDYYYYEDYDAVVPETEPEPEPDPEPEPVANIYQPDAYVSELLDTVNYTMEPAAEPDPEPIKQPPIPPPAPSVSKPPPKPKPKPPPPVSSTTAVPPPAPTTASILSDLNAAAQQAQNVDVPYEYEEDGEYVEIEYDIGEMKQEQVIPPPAIIPEPKQVEEVIETEAEQREYLSIEEAKKQTGGEKEKYLNDDDFLSVFGATRDEFYKFPGWKQKQKKKMAGFF